MEIRNKLAAALLCFSFQLLATAQDKTVFSFRRISPEGGFTFGAINTIGEDSDGFIWFGTVNGLYRYNTADVRKFTHNPDDSATIPGNSIRTIYSDRTGRLWIGTSTGLCYYDNRRDRFVTVSLSDRDGNLLGNDIRKVFPGRNNSLYILSSDILGVLDIGNGEFSKINVSRNPEENFTYAEYESSGRLWAGGERGTVWLSDTARKEFRIFCRIRGESISRIFPSDDGLWIGYNWAGADHVDYNGILIRHYGSSIGDEYTIHHNRVRDMYRDKENRLWISTYKGISIVENGTVRNLSSKEITGLTYSSIFDIFSDSRGGIWIGTWSGGLSYMSEYDNKFIHIGKDQPDPDPYGEFVSSFAENNDGIIYAGTELGNLNVLDRDRNSMVKVPVLSDDRSRIDNIKSLLYDKKENKLWMGTYLTGLWYRKDNDKLFKRLDLINDPRLSVYALEKSDSGIWAGSFGLGLFHYNTLTGKKIHYLYSADDPNTISGDQVRSLYVSPDRTLWIGTSAGLCHLDTKTGVIRRFGSREDINTALISDDILSIMEDRTGMIWIGTLGGGLFKYDRKRDIFIPWKPADEIIGDDIYRILADSKGILWISTERGISSIDPASGQIRNFYRETELNGNQFNPGAGFITGRGEILFGDTRGFIMFQPEEIKTNPFLPKVILTSLSVNNIPVDIHSKGTPLKSSIQTASEIKLSHSRNSLTFSFVANNFLLPEKNRFRYRLVNYDKGWVEAGNQNYATYTKIPPGRYTFEAKACNNDGLWNEIPAILKITIMPPLWFSGYAYALYAMLAILTGWLVRRFIRERQRFKKELLLERLMHESEGQVHQMKMQFFTNISHEFRTPLTLIVSPVNHILSRLNPEPAIRERLILIQRNANRLLQLINQLIDIHRIESGKLVLKPEKTELTAFLQEVISYFEIEAIDKNIRISFLPESERLDVMIDREKAEKIFFNILANAVKFTGENGSVGITVYTTHSDETLNEGYRIGKKISGSMICVEFRDNGPGIPEDDLKMIFERFGQGESHQSSGTGIGLHMAVEYTCLHNGYISVKSKPGSGSAFIINLPYNDDYDARSEKGMIKDTDMAAVNSKLEIKNGEAVPDKEKSVTILIIEDNYELRLYLRNLLLNDYRIVMAPNGKQGLDTALTIIPDLIITDIMMPQMDGFEVCRQIKNDIRTSHIPVILLTALYEPEKQVGGLKTGADAYVTKPFDENILLALVENLLRSREKLREVFSVSDSEWLRSMEPLRSDRMLIEKASNVVEQHLNDKSFAIDDLASYLGMSTSTMYRKLKALTDQSPTEFVRYVRLRKAISLMENGNSNVDEVGFAVGFNSHSYFTSSFKKQFGITPSEYLADLKARKPAL